MLSMTISGLKQSGNNIDVYLKHLIDNLRMLVEMWVDVYNACYEDNFRLRTMLFCSINYFSAYGNLSSYNVKGYYVCHISEENTHYTQLKHG